MFVVVHACKVDFLHGLKAFISVLTRLSYNTTTVTGVELSEKLLITGDRAIAGACVCVTVIVSSFNADSGKLSVQSL